MADASAPHRINEIAKRIGARSYLEIGVQSGKTFFNVELPLKVAVDPQFLFDYRKYQSNEVQFYNCTSDNFFASLSSSTKFDLVFLDGFHTFDQTYRDFCNTLLCTHERSIIIIDDTMPNDYYSTLRSQDVCIYRRKHEAPGSSIGDWRGDVFKILLFLNLFHSSLGFVTINDNGPEQTVVCRKGEYKALDQFFLPSISGDRYNLLLEYLYRLKSIDFNWLLENKDIFNIHTLDQFISRLE
jgi:hypothetical protein